MATIHSFIHSFIYFTFHWSYTDVELVSYTFSVISKASVHKLCLIVASQDSYINNQSTMIKVSISNNMYKVTIIVNYVLKYSSRL